MLYNGLIIDNTYQVMNEIGSGGMGVVYLALHLRLEKYVVLKRLRNSVEDLHWLRNEVDILKSLHHPNLPQVYDFLSYDGDLFTVIDYIHGYDFKYYLDNGYSFSENQLIKWLRQLAEVLCYLHNHVPPIYHMDIKPANIIVTQSMDICLIDFGISLTGRYRVHGISAYYSSPEQYANAVYIESGREELCVELDGRTDIYSVGATFYHLMTHVRPDLHQPPPEITAYSLPYSDSLIRIIAKAMQYQPAGRFKNADAFRKAIMNIHRSERGYRLNLAAQIAGSLIAGVMIVSGSLMVINDVRDSRLSAYESEYNHFAELYRSGDYEGAIRLGRELVNDENNKRLTDSRTRADIFHSMGDCYFNFDDYVNAAECYRFAYSIARDAGRLDGEELYYRDYAIALLYNNETAAAQQVLSELNARHPDSFDTNVVLARMHMEQPAEAEQYAKKALELAADADERYVVLEMLGDVYRACGDIPTAAGYYQQAREAKETEVILRELGSTRLMQCAQEPRYAQDAKDCYTALYRQYYVTENDIFNLCQSCLLLGDTGSVQEGLDIALRYSADSGESCRTDIIIALLYEAKNENDRAGDYAVKAHDAYGRLPESERARIDGDSLREISRIYKKHTGGDW